MALYAQGLCVVKYLEKECAGGDVCRGLVGRTGVARRRRFSDCRVVSDAMRPRAPCNDDEEWLLGSGSVVHTAYCLLSSVCAIATCFIRLLPCALLSVPTASLIMSKLRNYDTALCGVLAQILNHLKLLID